jgi:hypothetical protein
VPDSVPGTVDIDINTLSLSFISLNYR